MSLEDVLEPGEEVEHAGPEVTYDEDDYDTYFTSKDRLLLHKERGFISKEDDWTSWDLGKIINVRYGTGGTSGPEGGPGMAAGNLITVEMEEGREIEIECPRSDLPDFVAEARKRLAI